MKKTDTMQGSLDLLVLKVLSRQPKLHGYQLTAAGKKQLDAEVIRWHTVSSAINRVLQEA